MTITPADENAILFAALKRLVKPEDHGVCLATPLQGAPPDYRDRLTKEGAEYGPPAERQAYLQDAQRLVRAEKVIIPASRSISPEELRRVYHTARLVEGPDCKSLIVFVRPLVVGDWAYLLVSTANPCHGFYYRMSLARTGHRWVVQNTDLTGSRGGPPMCADRPWNAPSGLKIQRIRITD